MPVMILPIKSHHSPPALYPWGEGELVSFTAIFKLTTQHSLCNEPKTTAKETRGDLAVVSFRNTRLMGEVTFFP